MLKLAFCGNDCNVCARYLATQSNDVEQLKEVAELWYRSGARDKVVPPDEMICHGCATAKWCRYRIRECALETGVENCGWCDDYPCEKVLKAFEVTEIFRRNLRDRCSEKDCKRFTFSKRENLEKAHEEYHSRKRR